VTTPDRRVCSYVASSADMVLVTNSLSQLARLAEAARGETPSLASLPEYRFFRGRYVRGDAAETALVLISDATIRRWCGPRWRIGDSRRVRQAAFWADARARDLDALVTGTKPAEPPTAYGTLEFMTPIVELDLAQVTAAEAQAYVQWRDGYQRNWNWTFDPIALRLSIDEQRWEADLTVLPLIASSQYRTFLSLTQESVLSAAAGDPHGAPVHFVLAINRNSDLVRLAQLFLKPYVPELKTDPLDWLGPTVAVYADDDPFWKRAAAVAGNPRQREAFEQGEGRRVPVAVRFAATDGPALTAFLAAIRRYFEKEKLGTAQLAWETATYREETYGRITATQPATSPTAPAEKFVVYYHASGEALVLTPNEEVLKRAIDRQLAHRGKKPATDAASVNQLGTNVILHAHRPAADIAAALSFQDNHDVMQARAWGNLPILNEWRRRYPTQDPMALHERFWQTRLLCPGGGKYVWNDAWSTYESTVYGHPGEPRRGPAVPPALELFQSVDFGLTFEHRGLRARVVLERTTAPPGTEGRTNATTP
jgi:hypothetical protein